MAAAVGSLTKLGRRDWRGRDSSGRGGGHSRRATAPPRPQRLWASVGIWVEGISVSSEAVETINWLLGGSFGMDEGQSTEA